jgi:CubicO group peptidase (beta-lactamase class C family)
MDVASGQPIKVIDVSKEPKNDSGGAGAVSTAADYLRFSQMLLNDGQLEGTRILSRTTVALITSDHLGSRIATPFGPGELLRGTPAMTILSLRLLNSRYISTLRASKWERPPGADQC